MSQSSSATSTSHTASAPVSGLVIHPAHPAKAMELAAAEGWGPGADDADCFAAADPGGFLQADNIDGEAIGSVSMVRYGERYAFLGLFIVRADMRGRKVGSALFAAALALAGDRVVGLEGVPKQIEYYKSKGFELLHMTRRWVCAGGGAKPAADSAIVEASSVDFAELVAYDAAVFGAERSDFLRRWIQRPAGQALVFRRDGKVAGFGVVRRCAAVCKVGPLYADDPAAARALLQALRASMKEEDTIRVDVPGCNAASVALMQELGFALKPDSECGRMERGGRSASDWGRQFGISTAELG